ncbi:unnamed protein product [Ostreobium quekettii]|uniref:Sucrose phosphatase-like domain-containing protein n=1 Tax=Ostreobium quekettii TaxID=121088 RepID=A0A8S1J2U1_9CHLO|nr:unnamed protein product [Ostreobium quekettii]
MASGSVWYEDTAYRGLLDEDWDLDVVRTVAEELVRQFGNEGAVEWLDNGTEHPHRVALRVHIRVVDALVEEFGQRLLHNGLQVQTICSGAGEWRYVDCVPKNGGKLKALEFVRRLYGIARGRCVAAGDSGNDILMLNGENPAIVVGNAQDGLREWLLHQPQAERVIYTEARLAKGILEGLSRHGLY